MLKSRAIVNTRAVRIRSVRFSFHPRITEDVELLTCRGRLNVCRSRYVYASKCDAANIYSNGSPR
ncbi:hypothetical protein HD598_002180 [Neomicrococcus aestuarii]|uniref:Uncharacterized protein n=1 Tax=Neomicrococcus aestuarii TaxID=556325 RepID=A0A7W8TWY7_9MICC|nr:hypothetical protein [Neomicrococcus aestuarii]